LYLLDLIILRIWKTLPLIGFRDKQHSLAGRAPVLDGGVFLKTIGIISFLLFLLRAL
jgi:hypothetical protein